mgnify:CR=1 FL=1
MVTQSRFGESDACAVIRQNLEMIKKEKEEKGITGVADKKEDKGGNPSHCASCQFKECEILRQEQEKSAFLKSFQMEDLIKSVQETRMKKRY